MQLMNLLNLFNSINLKNVIQYLPDALFVVQEADGKILQINDKAAKIFELDKEDLENLNFNNVVIKGMELAYQSSLKDVAVIGGAAVNNDEFFVELNATLLDDLYFITIRDVTAMTNVLINAEKSGRLNKDKNLMLSKLAGDFKSPLQSIMGFSQALADGLGGEINEKQQKYVKIISKNAADLYDFMDKFFEFTSIEAGLLTTSYLVFDVENLIQNVIKSFEPQLKQKKLLIDFDTETPINKAIYSDENILKTILTHIIELSINLTELGTISIELSNPELAFVANTGVKLIKNANDTSYLQIRIVDNGVGLQENEIEGIFEPYTQLDKVNKKNLVRTFSLGTVKELVTRLNGTVWIETEVMKGSAFNIIIPVEKGAVAQDE